MTHFIVLSLILKFMPSSRFGAGSLGAIATLVGYLVAVIVVGAACYFLIENPGRRVISRYWAGRRGERVTNPCRGVVIEHKGTKQ